jgi:hypothetical protein
MNAAIMNLSHLLTHIMIALVFTAALSISDTRIAQAQQPARQEEKRSNKQTEQSYPATLRIRIEPCFGGIPLRLSKTSPPQRFVLQERTIHPMHDSLQGSNQELFSQDALSQPTLRAPVSSQRVLPADTIVITALRFYCSDWVLSGCNVSEPERFFDIHRTKNHSGTRPHTRLIDAADSSSCIVTLLLPSDDSLAALKCIWCRLGVDSLTNTLGALDGDLDPMHGMYWAWQSGYINFKLEGTSTRCTARHRKFQFHLGGYLSPFESSQILRLELPKFSEHNFAHQQQRGQRELVLSVDIKKFLEVIDLATLHSIMSPSYKAVKLSRQAARAFTLQAPTR